MRNLYVIDRDELGYAVDPSSGSVWRVFATGHNLDWPGHEDRVTFACERYVNGTCVEAVGFFNEEDCWNYLTGVGEKQYTIFDGSGSEGTVVREGLRIPDGMVKRYSLNVETSPKKSK